MASRTEYSAKNSTTSILSTALSFVFGYVTRLVFIQCLSMEYVGINGLFTDILNVLSLTELGMYGAITFALYKPIAQNDVEKIKSLMHFYKILYRIVAAVVLALGLLVIPFMDYLFKDTPKVDNLIIIYLMFLANTVLSYLFIYRRTLLEAMQRGYIGNIYVTAFMVAQYCIQIVLLITTRNFFLYVSVYLVCTVGRNIGISVKAGRLYPYLKDKNVNKLDKAERSDIRKNIFAMMFHKIGNVVINNTDNILISAFVGIEGVGVYANYWLIISSIRMLCEKGLQGIAASVGNLSVTEQKDRVLRVYEGAVFLGQCFYGVCALCLFAGLQPFIELSFGAQYLFDYKTLILLCITFFIQGLSQASVVFRDAMGLFWNIRYKPVIESGINLLVSIVLVQIIGLPGVFIGTIVSNLVTSFWVDPMIVNKKIGGSMVRYMLKTTGFFVLTIAIAVGVHFICTLIGGPLGLQFVLRVLMAAAISLGVFYIVFHRTKEYIYIKDKAFFVIEAKKNKN